MPERAATSSRRVSGVIAEWNDARGFGFIEPAEGGRRVFIHITAFPATRTRPFVGEAVTFRVEEVDGGRQRAAEVTSARTKEVLGGRRRGRIDIVSIVVLVGFAALFAVALASWSLPLWVVALYAASSAVAFAGYAADKRAAVAGRWREREGTLLLLGLIGGWPGAIIAQQALRHKTRKTAFQAQFWVTVAVNLAAFIVFAYPDFNAGVAGLLAAVG